MLQESWLSRWTFNRYSRSISQRSSLSLITTRNRMGRTTVQRDGRICKRKPHIISLQRNLKDTKDNGILLWTKKAKMILWNFDLIWEPLSWWKIVYTTNQENKLKSVSIKINNDDGIHLQAHRGGTSLNGIGSELIKFLNCSNLFLLQLVSFTVDGDTL